MKTPFSVLIKLIVFAALISSTSVMADSAPFGGEDNVSFAKNLWIALQNKQLVGDSAIQEIPYKGIHPHGAILETTSSFATVNNREGRVIVKRSYGGVGVSIDAVTRNGKKFLSDITVMFKREAGYDSDNQNWFWAKFNADGSLDTTPNGVQLAGQIAKGKPKGCIACHIDAPGNDYLFIN